MQNLGWKNLLHYARYPPRVWSSYTVSISALVFLWGDLVWSYKNQWMRGIIEIIRVTVG